MSTSRNNFTDRGQEQELRDHSEESADLEILEIYIDLTDDSENSVSDAATAAADDDDVYCPDDKLRNIKRELVRKFLQRSHEEEVAILEPKQDSWELQNFTVNRLLSGSLSLLHLDSEELAKMEECMVAQLETFHTPQRHKPKSKSCFNYLLLDPRCTNKLPSQARSLSDLDGFKIFLMAIFYVGKGQRSRPFNHLHEALSQANIPGQTPTKKTQRIHEVWASNRGIVILQCFQNITDDEAHTREACMIDAIGFEQLTNEIRGAYFPAVNEWSDEKKYDMGAYLLKKAYTIFLSEGEKEIRRKDIKQKKRSLQPMVDDSLEGSALTESCAYLSD